MVLLFLRDWRSVIVVVLNIPFALCGRRRRPLAHRPDDQPDDARRAGAGDRHPRGRGDRRDREHPPQDGARRRRSRWRSGGGTWTRRSRGSWRCSASWPSSSRRSSCRGRRRRSSSRSRWPSASRWSRPTCSPARSSRCSRSGSSATRRRDGDGARRSLFDRFAGCLRPGAVGRVVRLRWVVVPAYLAVAGARDRRRRAAGSAWRSSRRSTPAGSSSGSRPRPARGSRRPRRSPSPPWRRSASEVGRDSGRHLGRLRRHHPVELPDQRHLPVDRRARGGRPPRRPEAGGGHPDRGPQGAAPRDAHGRRCPASGSRSSRPTSSARS